MDLYTAAETGNIDWLEYAFRENSVEFLISDSSQAIVAAAENKHLDIIKWIHQHLKPVDVCIDDGIAIVHAVENGDLHFYALKVPIVHNGNESA